MCSFFFFFKQKTAYDMRISDWSSDVCSSDLHAEHRARSTRDARRRHREIAVAGDSGIDRLGHAASIQSGRCAAFSAIACAPAAVSRSEEHTSELQSLMRISYAVFCLKKKKKGIQRSNK